MKVTEEVIFILTFTMGGEMFIENWRFTDRRHAGRKLGEKLLIHAFSHPIVLALPRGGVPVAQEVARILGAPLDVIVTRKIGAPGQEEFGIGAISEDEVPLFNKGNNYDLNGAEIKALIEAEKEELRRRIDLYRKGRDLPDLEGKSVILVDDGLATGVTALAAGAFLKTLLIKELILAVPVCPHISEEIRDQFDEVICLYTPHHFQAVGLWYEKFNQVDDDEVLHILKRHHLDALIPRFDNKTHKTF